MGCNSTRKQLNINNYKIPQALKELLWSKHPEYNTAQIIYAYINCKETDFPVTADGYLNPGPTIDQTLT